MIDTTNSELYINFVIERHKVWERRQLGAPQPWTEDSVLARRKFTNVFRILDPGTQYVLDTLLDDGDERDNLMRLFLYRHTGRIDSWDYLDVMMGMPKSTDLEELRQHWHTYRGEGKTSLKSPNPKAISHGFQRTDYQRIMFTGAYLVFPQSSERGTDKLDSVIDLAKRLFDPRSPHDIMPTWQACATQSSRFNVFRDQKGVGDFMAMQILTDWGYSPFCGEDLEDKFVVAGPGATKGAALIDPTAKSVDIIRWAQAALWSHPECPALGSRLPSLMDVQNTLCEFSKYHRFMGVKPMGLYKPAHPGPQPQPRLPEHWRT